MKKIALILSLVLLCMPLAACAPSAEEQAMMDDIQAKLLNMHFKYVDAGTTYILTFDEDIAMFNIKGATGNNRYNYYEEYSYTLTMGKNSFRERVPVIELRSRQWEDFACDLNSLGELVGLETVDGEYYFDNTFN